MILKNTCIEKEREHLDPRVVTECRERLQGPKAARGRDTRAVES
jgi:hypothetical protein